MDDLTKVDRLDASLVRELASLYRDLPRSEQTVFNDPGFLRIVWKVFEEAGQKPFGLIYRPGGGQIAGAAFFRPGRVTLAGVETQALVPLVFKCSDFTPFLVRPASAGSFFRSVASTLERCGERVFFPRVRMHHATYLSDLSGFVFLGNVENPVCNDIEGAFDQVVRKKSLKRRTNWFTRNGDFRVVNEESVISEEQVEKLTELHIERWRYQNIRSKFEDPVIRRLYSRLAKEYNSDSQLGNRMVVTDLLFNGESVAMHIGFRWGSTFLYQIPVMNLKYMQKWPGEALMRALFIYATENSVDCFDLGFGDEDYKSRYANSALTYGNFAFEPTRWKRYMLLVRSSLARSPLAKAAYGRVHQHLRRNSRSAYNVPEQPIELRTLASHATGTGTMRELRFEDYVDFVRSSSWVPYEVKPELVERFRGDDRLFCLDESGEIIALGWFREGKRFCSDGIGSAVLSDRPILWGSDFRVAPQQQFDKSVVALTNAMQSMQDEIPVVVAVPVPDQPQDDGESAEWVKLACVAGSGELEMVGRLNGIVVSTEAA